MYKRVEELSAQIENKIINYRRDFHRYAESGWTEFRTASLIGRRLIELGYEVKLGKDVINGDYRMEVPSDEELEKNYLRALKQGADKELVQYLMGGHTGVMGTLKNGEGPIIALRFDIDALKVEESNDEDHFPWSQGFSSENKNVMHACGHDGHAAIGLGVAEILRELASEIKGTIKLIFQPAEEGVKGAKSMVEAGILDDVEYLISGHIGLKANKSGGIICGVGGFLATTKIDAVFTGKASHAGAAPEKGNNALLSAAAAVVNLYTIPRNSKGATRINVGKLVSGTERNIIADKAYLAIETRGETSELNEFMKNYAERILHSTAEMHGTELNIQYAGGAISSESDDQLISLVKEIANKTDYYKLINDEKVNFGASEDITYMMEKVKNKGGKAIYIMFGSDLKNEQHNCNFDFNEKDLKGAVQVYSNLIFDIMMEFRAK